MQTQKGFGLLAVLVIVAILAIGGGGAYVYINPQVAAKLSGSATSESAVTTDADDGVQTAPGDHPEVDHSANEGVMATTDIAASWKFSDAGETDGIPYTKVSVTVNGKVHEAGKFQGSCSEVGASGGVDGKGLLAGELSAVQCWYAGGGNEIGVFAHEDGGYEILVGDLSEGDSENPFFRGDFKVKASVSL